LAEGLDVRCGRLAFALRTDAAGGWSLTLGDGATEALDAVILTCPIPQAVSLTVTASVIVPSVLRRTDYERTVALLAVLDGPSGVPEPGGVQHPDDTFSFIGDNKAKGVSDIPALTFHANAQWSLAWWERSVDEIHAELRRHAAPWLGTAAITASEIKRWRFATPEATWPDPCWVAAGASAPLVVAGDAFAGPRVEGAALSGLAAAAQLASMIS
jgi:predicted NAD/FAD-dependent oxidoreductase